MKVEIKDKTLKKLRSLFIEKKLKPIKTREKILRKMDEEMREYLINEDKKRKEKNYSEALINENYFFVLHYLRENILGKHLNVHKERKRLLKRRKK